MAFHLNDLSTVPTKPWVYFFYDAKQTILYIGKAKNLRARITQYFAAWSVWKQDMLHKAVKVDFVTVQSESEALYLEDNLIKKHKPVYNSLLKGDNSYVYIKITSDPYPLVMTTRFRHNDGSYYIGPKHSTRELYKLMQFLRQFLRYRWCSKTTFLQWKICSDYHFWTCGGRCVYAKYAAQLTDTTTISDSATTTKSTPQAASPHAALIERRHEMRPTQPSVNASFVPAYTPTEALQYNITMQKILIDFFSGKTKPLQDEIKREIEECIVHQRFERAGQLRDVYNHMDSFTQKQSAVLSVMVTGKVMKITQIEGWFVVAIMHLYEGKVIDLLRLKYRAVDTDIGDIISDFQSEYGENVVDELTWATPGARVRTRSLRGIAAKLVREMDAFLDTVIEGMVASSTFEKDNIMNDILRGLQARYSFPRFPYMIECVDISHLSGWRTSGAVVCTREWLPYKHNYKKYKIKWGGDSSDDYASMREVLIRRWKWVDIEKEEFPDVFVLDGGKGQLGVIQALSEEFERFRDITRVVHFCALWKGDARKRSAKSRGAKEEVYWYDEQGNMRSQELIYDEVDRVLTALRDEAHRFSNAYRKKQMSMEIR